MELEQLLTQSSQTEYPYEIPSCAEKLKYWKSNGFEDRSPHLGMIKTILFAYRREGQENYILASTLGQKKIDLSELAAELGLSAAEADTLDHTIDDATIEKVTGRKRGAVSPFAPKLDMVETIYFSRELLEDLTENPLKEYDIPLSLTTSIFVKGADLYTFLQQNPTYKLPAFQEPAGLKETEPVIDNIVLEVVEWTVKEVDSSQAGYAYLFNGTRVKYGGQEYEIKNPRHRKEGMTRRRKKVDTIALPISRSKGKVNYEYAERGRKRVLLPIDYETLENTYHYQHRDLFQIRNKIR